MTEQKQQSPPQSQVLAGLEALINFQVAPALEGVKREGAEARKIVEQMSKTLQNQLVENEKAIETKISAHLKSVTDAIGNLEMQLTQAKEQLTAQVKSVSEENKLKRKKIVDYLKAITE